MVWLVGFGSGAWRSEKGVSIRLKVARAYERARKEPKAASQVFLCALPACFSSCSKKTLPKQVEDAVCRCQPWHKKESRACIRARGHRKRAKRECTIGIEPMTIRAAIERSTAELCALRRKRGKNTRMGLCTARLEIAKEHKGKVG